MRRTGAAVAPRLLRLFLVLASVLVACGLAGCLGSGSERQRPAGPLPEALAYLDGDFPAVIVVETDPRSGPLAKLDSLASRSGGWKGLKRRLEALVERNGLDFGGEVRPQLGSPFALGIGLRGERVGAIRVRAPSALRSLVARRVLSGRASRVDDYKGALVWREKSRAVGALDYSALVRSDLVVAGSEESLRGAIDAADGDESLAFDRAFLSQLNEIGPTALVRGVGDARRLIEGSDPEQAARERRIPWIRALGLFTLAARVERRGIGIDIALRTDRIRLSERDLPLPPGPLAPRLHDLDAASALAVREPQRLFRFVERLLAATDPERFARYQTGLEQLRAIFGVDVHKDLLSKMENLSIASVSATGATFEASLKRGAGPAFARALDRAQPFVAGVLGDFAPGTTVEGRGSGAGRVWLVKNRGLTLARYAVREGTLVGSIGLAELPRPARGRRLPGARGSLSLRGNPRRIAALGRLVLRAPNEAIAFLAGLGDLRLGIRAEPNGLTGKGRVDLARPRS